MEAKKRAPYRVHGWRWHHLSLVRDLGVVGAALSGRRVCTEGAAGAAERRAVARAFAHVLEDNWAVHDAVEGELLYPWVATRSGVARRTAIRALDARRGALKARRERVLGSLRAFQQLERGGDVCAVRARGAAADVHSLRAAAAATFAAAERVVVPAVRALYSEDEQRTFNRNVIRGLSARQAQVALVIFRDGIYDSRRASAADRADFERQVPRAIRALVPVWRRALCGIRASFFMPPHIR